MVGYGIGYRGTKPNNASINIMQLTREVRVLVMATPQPETIANGQPLAQPHSLQVDGQVEQYDAQVQIQGMPIVDGEDGGMSQGAEEDHVNGDGGGEAEQAEGGADGKTGGEPGEGEKTKKKRRAAATLEHEGGKSIFPVSRVQRIMKADRVRT